MGEVHYMISEAAKQVNVETHALRYWEDELALDIGRTEMGHRYYTEENIQLFRCIKELKEQGLQLRNLKKLIPDMLLTKAKLKAQKEEQQELKKQELTVSEPEVIAKPSGSSKLEDFKILMSETLQSVLILNNEQLSETVSQLVSQNVIQEIGCLLQAKEQQEEARYKKLDCLIRQQQVRRKESTHNTALTKLKKLLEV